MGVFDYVDLSHKQHWDTERRTAGSNPGQNPGQNNPLHTLYQVVMINCDNEMTEKEEMNTHRETNNKDSSKKKRKRKKKKQWKYYCHYINHLQIFLD